MPNVPIIMPQLGESIAEATVLRFLVAPGDAVQADQEVMEVETNKAVMSVTAPCEGTLSSWSVAEGESYPVASVLGHVEVAEEVAVRMGVSGQAEAEAAGPGQTKSAKPAADSLASAPALAPRQTVSPTVRGLPVPAHAAKAGFMSPRLKARMNEFGLHAADLAGIPGSGSGGRVTIEDFERFMDQIEQNRTSPASSMRVAVADAMRRSWTRPLATVGLPIIMDNLLAHRKNQDPKPGPALYALRALALALAANSAAAGRLIGERIVHPTTIDVGFAVEVEDGVLVPVIRQADKVSLKELVTKYNDLVDLARRRRLPAEATEGSIATVTNFGTFGLQWATPIPLPEQTLVLGLGAGRKAPAWDEKSGTFVPVIEAELTLSFDHRVLDGGAAGRLLTSVRDLLLTPQEL